MQDLFQRSAELAKAAGRPLLSGDVLMAALDADHGTVARTLVGVAIEVERAFCERVEHLRAVDLVR